MKPYDPTRREFLKTAGRWTVLGVLGAIGIDRISLSKRADDVCTSDGICSSCGKLRACGHPSALSTKADRHSG